MKINIFNNNYSKEVRMIENDINSNRLKNIMMIKFNGWENKININLKYKQ